MARAASHVRQPLRRIGIATIASGLLLATQSLAAPGVAAATVPLTITADRPAAVPAGHNWSYNDFFPRTISVHQGATIRFAIQGFHTATLVPPGPGPTSIRRSMGLLKPDGDDTSANPNGSTHTQINLGAVFPIPGGCGSAAHPCTFDGSSPVSSGAPLAGPIAPLNVKVTAKAGFYRFVCLIHPQMQGWLVVVPSDFHATTAADLATQVTTQIASDRKAGYAAEAAANRAGVHLNADGTRTWTITAGTSSPNGHVAVLEMLPRDLSIRKGDKVTWVSRATNEPHTVTFPRDLHTDMVALCESGATDVPAVPTVIPPTGPQDFTCGGGPPDEVEFDGGNGVSHVTSRSTVSDSGVIASSAELAGFALPSTAARNRWTVSFVGASRTTYHYLCQIHAGMVGTIVVH
jgi:plastocyanin